MITVENLIFEYPGVRALDDVSFRIEPNTVTALVGPNGAGKTTLMRCIAALDSQLSGTITVGGVDVQDNPRAVHGLMGFLYDFYGLYDELTVEQSLRHRVGAQGVAKDRQDELVAKAAERLNLTERMDQKVGTLSRGWRQRVSIAMNIAHEPKLLLLDEPASGLDPTARAELSSVLRDLASGGMTIIVSSHILSELEDYSTHMLAIDNARMVAHKPLGGTNDTGLVELVVTLTEPYKALASHLEDGEELVVNDSHRAIVRLSSEPAARKALLKRLTMADVPVSGLETSKSSLQDTYFAHGKESGT